MDKRVNCMVREGEGGECLLSMHEGLDVEAEDSSSAPDLIGRFHVEHLPAFKYRCDIIGYTTGVSVSHI